MGHLVQLTCQSRVTYSRLHRTLFRGVLNISREQESTTSLGSVEGKENLPRPAGHTPPNAPEDPISFLGSQGTLMARGLPVVPQHSQVPLRRAALQQVSPKPVLVHGVVPLQVQDPALALVELSSGCLVSKEFLLQHFEIIYFLALLFSCLVKITYLCNMFVSYRTAHYHLCLFSISLPFFFPLIPQFYPITYGFSKHTEYSVQ